MALIEVEEAEINESRALASTLKSLMSNPESRRKVLEAQKIVKPDAVIPELDAAKPVLAEVSALRDEMTKWMKAQEEKEAKRVADDGKAQLVKRWTAGQALAKEQGYNTAEGLAALEKFMEERGIADHEVAIPYFEKIHPPAKSEAPVARGFDIFKPESVTSADADMKLLLDQQFDRFLDVSIPKVLADVRSGNRAH